MKLLFIADNFPPVVDGVGDYTYHAGKQLAKAGHTVYVICSRKEEIRRFALEEPLLKVLPLISNWDRTAIVTITKLLDEIKPDWVIPQYVPYSYNYYGLPFWFCLLLARLKLKGYRVAVTCHEIFIDLEWKSAKYWPVAVGQRVIAYAIGALADRVIVSIARTRRQLGLLRGKITRIPIGSNIVPVTLSPLRLFELKRQYAPDGEFLFVSFGIRDQEAAVKVIDDLVKEGLPVKLLLLGNLSGAAIQRLNLQIGDLGLENRVVVTGYLPSDRLFEVLSCGNAFILLEEKRGGLTTKSGSLAAAYAAGLPVIGTAGHMTDDFFRNGVNALLAREGDYQTTLENARKIVQDEALRKKLQAGTAETYSNRLSWEKIAENYQAILS